MPNEWDISDDDFDSWIEEWDAVDRAAADYLAEQFPGVRDALPDDDARWLDALGETISPEEPKEHEVESVSAVMALQHADWIGLALGVVQRGPGSDLDPELVQADIERLEEVEGEIEDSHLAVLDMALLHLTPRWQDLGVLDEHASSSIRRSVLPRSAGTRCLAREAILSSRHGDRSMAAASAYCPATNAASSRGLIRGSSSSDSKLGRVI